jgi:hypothetical protein
LGRVAPFSGQHASLTLRTRCSRFALCDQFDALLGDLFCVLVHAQQRCRVPFVRVARADHCARPHVEQVEGGAGCLPHSAQHRRRLRLVHLQRAVDTQRGYWRGLLLLMLTRKRAFLRSHDRQQSNAVFVRAQCVVVVSDCVPMLTDDRCGGGCLYRLGPFGRCAHLLMRGTSGLGCCGLGFVLVAIHKRTQALTLGVCTALLGPWADRVGPRAVGLTAAACWSVLFSFFCSLPPLIFQTLRSSGLALAGLGCYLDVLPLIYLGYSVLGGAGW